MKFKIELNFLEIRYLLHFHSIHPCVVGFILYFCTAYTSRLFFVIEVCRGRTIVEHFSGL